LSNPQVSSKKTAGDAGRFAFPDANSAMVRFI